MTAFEVLVNGHSVCEAGAPGAFSLSAGVHHYPHKSPDYRTKLYVRGTEREPVAVRKATPEPGH